jgi:hypothetical protein
MENYQILQLINANQLQYAYREMYRTKAQALQNIEKNKYLIKGEYLGSTRIPRGLNVLWLCKCLRWRPNFYRKGIDYTVIMGCGIILDQALLNL